MTDMFVEVHGEAELVETVVEYRAELIVAVRAAQNEAAVADATELRERTITALRASGLTDDELAEGAGAVWRPWFWKKRPGQEAARKIIIATSDLEKMFRALASLEPLFSGQRYSLTVAMRSPRFQPSPADEAEAQKSAIAKAKAQAEVIAQQSEVKLGSIIQVEELGAHRGHSGVFGDEDWRGYGAVAAGNVSTHEDEPTVLDAATRIRLIRYRVRFSITSNAA